MNAVERFYWSERGHASFIFDAPCNSNFLSKLVLFSASVFHNVETFNSFVWERRDVCSPCELAAVIYTTTPETSCFHYANDMTSKLKWLWLFPSIALLVFGWAWRRILGWGCISVRVGDARRNRCLPDIFDPYQTAALGTIQTTYFWTIGWTVDLLVVFWLPVPTVVMWGPREGNRLGNGDTPELYISCQMKHTYSAFWRPPELWAWESSSSVCSGVIPSSSESSSSSSSTMST